MKLRTSEVNYFKDIAINFLLIGILIFSFSCTPSQLKRNDSDYPDPVKKLRGDIEEILKDSSLAQSRVGIKIVSLENNQILFEQNSQQLFHPASNTKIITTSTALKRLGPDHVFQTILYVDSNAVSQETVNGNIYLKGFGDPDLTTSDLEMMIMELKKENIREISGDIIFDDFFFDSLYLGAGWMWDDASAWEYAPIHALSVNDNCVIIEVNPAKKAGDTLLVQMKPQTAYMQIENQGLTVDSMDTLLIRSFSVERQWLDSKNKINITGGLAFDASTEEYEIDVIDGAYYTATLFSELLVKHKIGFSGEIHRKKVPQKAQILVKHSSKPLSLVVYNINKISDNLAAEMVLKTLAAKQKGLPGTAEKGISVIYEYLNELGIDSTTYHLVDGSGVSRYNVVTPHIMIQLLKGIDQDFNIQAEFVASLPLAGADGTLKNRMKNTPAFKKLRAKTGSLKGVRALSGYTTTGDGEKLVFSIMIEHFLTKSSNITKIQDKIGALLSDFTREPGKQQESQ
jgi:D-alanyl-D-alanine carboxypeptidase/D-alanyl-D-alanine-endopeptidase (penicillin-binding protein 4)